MAVAKVDAVVRRETGFVALWVVLLSLLMQAVFLVGGWWSLPVLWGNLLSGVAAVGNFFAMGLTVQKAVDKEEKHAASIMKLSQVLRMLALFLAVLVGVLLPSVFNLVTLLVPLFFPRIAIALRPLFDKRQDK